MKQKKEDRTNQVVIYQASNKQIELQVRLNKETVWLDAHQLADLYSIDRTGIVRHINNIYKTSELEEHSTCAKIAQVAKDGRTRKMNLYNLDMIISVGYRVNSKQATKFRIWATSVLRQYLIQGYAVNQKRLKEATEKFVQLQQTISFLAEKSQIKSVSKQSNEIFSLLNNYAKSLQLLEQYDSQNLSIPSAKTEEYKLSYKTANKIINQIKLEIKANSNMNLFGKERETRLADLLGNINQTYDQKELYSGIAEKAAHLLYFIIKDHPFVDGNKRCGSFLFIYYLDKNSFLYKKTGERKINDNALTALSLLVAESNPNEKDTLIKLITNLLSE